METEILNIDVGIYVSDIYILLLYVGLYTSM